MKRLPLRLIAAVAILSMAFGMTSCKGVTVETDINIAIHTGGEETETTVTEETTVETTIETESTETTEAVEPSETLHAQIQYEAPSPDWVKALPQAQDENTKQLLGITFFAGMIALLLNIVLIPSGGLWAAAIITYVAFLYQGYSGFFYKFYKQSIKVPFPYMKLFLLFALN